MDRFTKFLVGIVALAMTAQVSAGVVRDDKGDTDWEFILTPYLWAISLNGTSQVGPFPPLDIDADFGDLLDNLNMALAAHMELHRGKWAIALDPMWAQLEMDLGDDGSAEINISLIELWGSYKLTPNWEILGGARFQEQDIDVEPGLPSPPFPESVGLKEDWLDWFLGARFDYGLSPKWRIVGRGDVTLAGDSDSGYSASLFFNRKIRKTMMLNLGYRYMKTEYYNDVNYAWDVDQHGPVIGYTWSF